MRIAIIAAVAENRAIGRDGGLPWRLPVDLARFKRLTWGHHLVLGRRTFEGLGRPLPGRTTLVVSRRRPALAVEGVRFVPSLEAAIEIARDAGESELFVAGGAEIYRLALPFADRLYLTRIAASPKADTFFPPFDPAAWHLVEREEHSADERHAHPFSFQTFERSAAG